MALELGGDMTPGANVMTRHCRLDEALATVRQSGNAEVSLPPFPYTVSGMYAHIDATQLSRYIEDYANREGLTSWSVNARVQNPFFVMLSIQLAGQANKLLPLIEWLDGMTRQ